MENLKENLAFSRAIEILRSGGIVARSGWNGACMYLHLQIPDENSKMRKPYIYISCPDGDLIPWVASHTDLLANDWYLLE